jgi:hypothetical protein
LVVVHILLRIDIESVPFITTVCENVAFISVCQQSVGPPANELLELLMRTCVGSKLLRAGFVVATVLLSPQSTLAQFTQQGPKLVGTLAVGPAYQGTSVALSGDGNTAIVGAPHDSGYIGAALVWIRSGGAWTQQAKLAGSDGAGESYQGQHVALSSDGNTAIVGGYNDGSAAGGAAWVYTRNNGAWTQQGSKLVGTGGAGFTYQGYSVALSGDGNTAIVGGFGDNSFFGAAWVYTRSNGIWTQQARLVGSAIYTTKFGVYQGWSVALSADGNTAIVGGPYDNSGTGAAWVYTRSGGVWTQQGSKLVGSGAPGPAEQGWSVALSANGNTAIVGGFGDNSNDGVAWVYIRKGSVWTQQGSMLVGTGGQSPALTADGNSVALSGDGNTAIVGGPNDNSRAGTSTPAKATSGLSGAANWLASVEWEPPDWATPLHCLAMRTPLFWAALLITLGSGRPGSSSVGLWLTATVGDG